jgi:hypothetical protein
MRIPMPRVATALAAYGAVCLWLTAQGAQALPTAPTALCNDRPDIPSCAGGVPACALCHESTDPPKWNAYGTALKAALPSGLPFDEAILRAMDAADDLDSDGDGLSNGEELVRGSSPSAADVRNMAVATGQNPRYAVGSYDFRFAYRRVSILYCAASPSYEELTALSAGSPTPEQLRERLHAKLDACLRSDYWREEGLARLADKRIRPLRAAGPDSNIQIGGYRLVIGDYNRDYRLFRYVLSEDRDLRELLTAQYHISEAPDGTLTQVRGALPKTDEKALAGGEPLPEQYRAGMLTTQWFLTINTMFSALPRTTAAQAYRAYLGTDIASSEGLRPVAGEPVDVDDKGVDAPRCANCHSTLDPMAYAFAEYEGIQISADLKFGYLRPERPKERMPAWDPSRQKSMLLGKPVANLVAWAHTAAESDEFKRAMVDMLFRHAFNRTALPVEQDAYTAIWRALPGDGYSANRIIHRLIDTQTFGSP